jgi:hypothetical protein
MENVPCPKDVVRSAHGFAPRLPDDLALLLSTSGDIERQYRPALIDQILSRFDGDTEG